MIRKTATTVRDFSAIVIGGSAGSIPVLNQIISSLPGDFSLPVIICVHRMRNISEGMREVLALGSALEIIEPNDKDSIQAGRIYVAPSNYHLFITENNTFALSTESMVNYSRPSIDLTLSSAAHIYKKNLLGILLTGANKDGALGMECIKKNGGLTIVQDPETCVAPYMPMAAIERSCVDLVLSVKQISAFIKSAAGIK
ncbi:MAG: chemotaxis protein CheB [Bacteroidota bacterium]|nr:chemotaxis protein CheB [Bacteroidota bacterium]